MNVNRDGTAGAGGGGALTGGGWDRLTDGAAVTGDCASMTGDPDPVGAPDDLPILLPSLNFDTRVSLHLDRLGNVIKNDVLRFDPVHTIEPSLHVDPFPFDVRQRFFDFWRGPAELDT